MCTVSWKPPSLPPPDINSEPPRIPGYVYIVQMQGYPSYKIGHTVNLQSRMSAFGILLPFPYRLVFARKVSDCRHLEQILHAAFKHQRMNGEWFRLSAKDLKAADAWLLYVQSQDLIRRVMQAFMDDPNSIGFPGMAIWARFFLRLHDRDARRSENLAIHNQPDTNNSNQLHVISEVVFERSLSKKGAPK